MVLLHICFFLLVREYLLLESLSIWVFFSDLSKIFFHPELQQWLLQHDFDSLWSPLELWNFCDSELIYPSSKLSIGGHEYVSILLQNFWFFPIFFNRNNFLHLHFIQQAFLNWIAHPSNWLWNLEIEWKYVIEARQLAIFGFLDVFKCFFFLLIVLILDYTLDFGSRAWKSMRQDELFVVELASLRDILEKSCVATSL